MTHDAIDPMTVATRFFNTPLLIDPGKALVIAEAMGPRFLGLQGGARIEVEGGQGFARPDAAARSGAARAPRAGSLVADGLFEVVRHHQSYSVIDGVAVIPVVGSLVRRGSWVGQSSGVTSYEGISAQVRAAIEDPQVRGIALEIDSFGGEAHGAFALAREIRAARAVKPVEAFLAEFALSAGYMIASQADRITVPEFGEAGSIGVVMMHVDYEEKLARDGVRVTLIHSGAHKVDGHPFAALPEAVRDEMQAQGDQMWTQFGQEVAEGRGGRLDLRGAMATEARSYRGIDAVRAGLADQVGEAREAFADFVQRVAAATPPRRGLSGRPAAANAALVSGLSSAAGPLAASAKELLKGVAVAADALGQAGAAMPETGATALHSEENDMPKDAVDQPSAEARTESQAVDTKTSPTAAVETQPQAAEATWVLEKCERAGIAMGEARAMIAAGLTREAVLERIVDAKAARADDGGDIRPAGRAVIVADARDRAREGMTLALQAKAGLAGGERNEFSGMSLREMARKSLEVQGIDARGNAMQFAGAVFAPAMASGGMHSTSDFASILENVADKSMMRGFTEAEETYDRFTSVGSLSDFKPTRRVGMDSFPSLIKVDEGAEFTYGTMGDHAETVVLATYGRLFAITRQTIINDDLAAFTRVPQLMGRAARRTVGDLVYGVLTANANMSDGVALFHADHGNLAASGSGPSEAAINAGITAMMTQKDRGESAHALNIMPRYMILPPKWRSAAMQSLNSEYAPDDTDKIGTAKMGRAYNTVQGAAEPIFDARLTGDAWYMAADPASHDVIEVGYLDGNAAPFLEQQDGFSVDGREFKVRIDACAKALAFQTLYKNPGA